MQTDRHHATTFRVQDIETVLQVVEELLPGIKPLWCRKTHVIRVQRVRHHQLWRIETVIPVRHIVRIRIGVINELAILSCDAMTLRAASPQVPSCRSRTRNLRVNLQCLAQMFALGYFINELIVNPAQAVTGDFPVRSLHRCNGLRVTLQSHCNAKNCDWNVLLGEQAV